MTKLPDVVTKKLDETTNPAGSRLLSVIMPAHNAADTIRQQLDALRGQSYQGRWELIVVNNRSTDATVSIIHEYQQLLPRMGLVHALEGQGRAYACNVGARAARGEALIFCDHDDVAAPGWLGTLATALETHPFVAGSIEVESLNRSTPWRPNPQSRPENGVLDPILGFLPYAIGCNLAVTTAAFEQVGGFSEEAHFCEDVDLSWRLQLAGIHLHFAPTALMYYRYRTSVGAVWRQAALHAEGHVYLYKRFAAHGMPPPLKDKVRWRYWWLFRKTPFLWAATRRGREKWLYRAAATWGRLRGSLRYRTRYF
jgi:GT2 family glycosyltransferase